MAGRRLALTYHPTDVAAPTSDSQVETVNVWGSRAQDDLVRCRVGIVGLGSVGSLAAEALSRVGFRRLTYIDFDLLEMRNLDRMHGALLADVLAGLSKVQVDHRPASLRPDYSELLH